MGKKYEYKCAFTEIPVANEFITKTVNGDICNPGLLFKSKLMAQRQLYNTTWKKCLDEWIKTNQN